MIAPTQPTQEKSPEAASQFVQTRWSVILGAKAGSFEALEQICMWYREPLRRHILRRGFKADAADDLIQDFLTKKMLAGGLFRSVQDPKETGRLRRFRTFLLTCLDNFLIEKRRRLPDPSDTEKGVPIGVGVSDDDPPFELSGLPLTNEEETHARADWAEAVMKLAEERHREEYLAAGKSLEAFRGLNAYYLNAPDASTGADLARLLGTSENTFYVTKHRFAARRTYWAREVVKDTVSNPEDWENEVRDLLGDP